MRAYDIFSYAKETRKVSLQNRLYITLQKASTSHLFQPSFRIAMQRKIFFINAALSFVT